MSDRYFEMFSISENKDEDIVIECVRAGCSGSKAALFGDHYFEDQYLYSGYPSASDDPKKSDLVLTCVCCGVSELGQDVPWMFRGSTIAHREEVTMKCLGCGGVMDYHDENDEELIYKCSKCGTKETV